MLEQLRQAHDPNQPHNEQQHSCPRLYEIDFVIIQTILLSANKTIFNEKFITFFNVQNNA